MSKDRDVGREWQKALLHAMRKERIPAVSLAFIDGQKISPFSFGVKNSLTHEPVSTTTVFEGASLSKPVVAYAALKLCEEAVLVLDQPLCEYLQAFKSSDDPYLSEVTLRHILSHTAGFPTENLKRGQPLKLAFKPGTQFAYSGESYRYLGEVIEKVTGHTFATCMQESVLTPLKMQESSFVWKESYQAQIAVPHDRKGMPLEKWKPSHAVASFSLHTTAIDYAQFMLAARSYPLMLEAQYCISEHIAWGLGFGIETNPQGNAIWHSGDNGTFQNLVFLGEERGFVMLTNSSNGFKLCRLILDLLIGEEHPLLDFEQFDSYYDESVNDDFLANWWKNL